MCGRILLDQRNFPKKRLGVFQKITLRKGGGLFLVSRNFPKKTSAFSFKTKEIPLQKRLLLIKTVSYNQSTPVLQGPSGVHFLKSEVPL